VVDGRHFELPWIGHQVDKMNISPALRALPFLFLEALLRGKEEAAEPCPFEFLDEVCRAASLFCWDAPSRALEFRPFPPKTLGNLKPERPTLCPFPGNFFTGLARRPFHTVKASLAN